MSKILFWVGTNFTHYCIANVFQKKMDDEIFGIFDVTNKPRKYFESQKLVDFKKIWFYHDMMKEIDAQVDLKFLKDFEERYNIPLTTLAYSERVFMEYNEFYRFNTKQILKILELECKFYEKVLSEVNPDFIFMYAPYFHHEVLFFKLCKAKNIKVLELNATRFGSQGVIGFDDELKKFDEFIPTNNVRTFEELRKYFEEKHIVKQNLNVIKRTHGSIRNNIESAIQYFIFSDSENIKTHYTYFGRNKFNVFKNYLNDVFRIKKRKKFIDTEFVKDVPEGNYILYPLQTEAESALLIDSPLFVDPVDIVKKITKSMPVDYQLLVKEHPIQEARSWRSVDTYKKIIETPGVIPIHPDAKITEILKKASLVITVSSSVGLDSLFYEVPSLMFAQNTYSIIPSVGKIRDVGSLSEYIKKMLNTEVKESDLEKYIQFSEKISFDFDPAGFTQDLNDFFHFSGKLVDVNIEENQMKEFLVMEKEKLEILVTEYIKKMNVNDN